MARRSRPASESYQSVCYSGSSSVSLSNAAEIVGLDDEDDHAPIFSLSKSSMDVVMVSGLPYKRDPAWARTDLRRSSSTNTHSEQNSVTLQQLHPQMWQHINSTNYHQLPLTAQNVDMQSPPVLSERWIANMQRWSGCSASTHSRSSTPDTIVWKEGNSRPSSLTQITSWSAAPDSPVFKSTSSATTHSPSPLINPLQTPTLTNSSSSLLTLNAQQPLQASTSSPLSSNSPNLQHLTSSKDEGFLENHMLSFTFPSPIPSSVSTGEGDTASDAGCLDDVIEALQSPGSAQLLERGGVRSQVQLSSPLEPGSCLSLELCSPGGMQLSESGELRSPVQNFGYVKPDFCPSLDIHSPGDTRLSESGEIRSPVQMCGYLEPTFQAEGQESESKHPVCHLQLPWQPVQSFSTGRERRLPLVSSRSDSQLGECCRCNLNMREGLTKAPKVEVFREGGTMTSRLQLVDAAVQTISPIGSFWGLRRNTSNSNMGSHSLLGSPPGSRLNLISSVGSNSNLVSPSSSMFPVSSEEEEERHEDDPAWEINSPTSHNLERRRSCLKMQGETKDKLHRRSSIKQVQWDEEGMTWDIHGAAVDPEVLSTAIQRHLELKNSPQLAKHLSKKKKKAPKPPYISNVVKAMTPELNPPAMIISSTCMVEPESEDLPEAEKGSPVAEKRAVKKEETAETPRRISRAEAVDAEEDEEVYGGEGSSQPKSPSHSSSGQSRRRNVIRSLRPGWCGGSRKADD